jgi:hypothetical protein
VEGGGNGEFYNFTVGAGWLSRKRVTKFNFVGAECREYKGSSCYVS